MRVLIDTNVFLWAALRPERVSSDARAAILDSANARFVSSVTPWEMAIKLERGKLALPASLSVFTAEVLADLRAIEMPVSMSHAAAVAELSPIHRDPFDRMLVAQALVERLAIVSSDRLLSRYGVRVIW